MKLPHWTCLFAVLPVAALTLCSGCVSANKTGSHESPDGKYVIYGHVQGASGRAYDAYTAKTVFITVQTRGYEAPTIVTNHQNGASASEEVVTFSGKPGKPVIEKEYRIQGSGVCCDDVWGNDDSSVTVFVYDYGPGVDWEVARNEGFPKRSILTLHYQFDSKPDLSIAEPAR